MVSLQSLLISRYCCIMGVRLLSLFMDGGLPGLFFLFPVRGEAGVLEPADELRMLHVRPVGIQEGFLYAFSHLLKIPLMDCRFLENSGHPEPAAGTIVPELDVMI